MVNLQVRDKRIDGISAVIFDKDGTLIDLYTYWASMIALRAEKLCLHYHLAECMYKDPLMFAMGVDVENKRIRPEGPVGILPRKIVQKAAEDYLTGLGKDQVEETCFDVFQSVDEESVGLLHQFIKFIPGAFELLKALKENQCHIAIATTDKTERANLAVQHLGIEDLIDVVVGADRVEHSKPAPDMIQLIQKELKIPAGEIIMVGDAKTDVQSGINAGCKASIAVLTGLTPASELSALTPYVVDSVQDIHIKFD